MKNRRFKKGIRYFGILCILSILFRGFLYRVLINYSKVNVRSNITLTDSNLIQEIDQRIGEKKLSIEEVVTLSNNITSERLSFTFIKVSSNPNKISELKKANCIGYSSLFNSIGNYVIEKQNMHDSYEFKHLVGKLDLLGFDIHTFFSSPFFKDHDFNEVRNKHTGEQIYIDPSLRDYFKINSVKSK